MATLLWPDGRPAGAAAAAVLAALLAALLPAGAHADNAGAAASDLTTLPFEQLLALDVYSASRFTQKLSEAPSSVSVITASDIRSFGWRTLADALRSMRGLYVSYDRNYSYLGARGFLRSGDYNTRFLLQIDGNRVNDNVYDQAQLGAEFPLDMELVERIEYVPGPGSSIYGANAFFGVINVITRRPRDLEGISATVQGGQAGSREASARYGWRDGHGQELLLAASRAKSDGRDLFFPEYATAEQHQGIAHGLDYETVQRLYAKAIRGPFTLTALYAERRKGVPTAAFEQPFNDPRSRGIDTQNSIDLGYRHALAGQSELTARLYWGSHDSLGDYVLQDDNATLNLDISNGRWWGAEAKLLLAGDGAHKLIAGAEYQADYRLRQLNYDADPAYVYLNENHHGKRFGLYLQDEISLSSLLLLNAGLRYDHHNSTGGVLNPRVALIYQLAPATTLKAMYGSAYRAPNNYEQYYMFVGDGGQLANPQLRRERIRSTELALVRQWPDNRRLTLSLFRNEVTGLIGQVSDEASGLPIFVNGGATAARGLETEYEHKWGGSATLRASYSRQQVAHSAGTRDNSPRQLGKLNLSVPLRGPWQAGLEMQYVGPRATLDGGQCGGFWLANLNLYSVRLSRHADLALAASNLFDRRYADPVSAQHLQQSIVQDGRRLLLKLNLSY
ncbi:TonB-dependent receptor [Oxalobacteraceae bacterium]|nr:TonB-dependent receptor [Oxalobacteraceae bacterium]